jgi:outer membrane receptor protein involved in Fe transport
MSGVPRYDRYVDFRAPALGRDWEHSFDPQTRQLGAVRYRFKPDGGSLTSIEATASLAVQREGRSRARNRDGQPDSSLTLWRDDVYTPGFAVVGSNLLSLAHRPLSLTWGGDFYRDALNSHGNVTDLTTGESQELVRNAGSGTIPSGRFPDGATASRLGFFLAADWSTLEQLRVSVGARWGSFNNKANVGTELGGSVENSSTSLTGQLGVVFLPLPEWSIAFRLAEGFRSPNLYDLTNVGPIPSGIVLPNTQAKPEKSLSTEVGVRYAGQDGAFDFTVYYTRIRDFIDRVPGSFQGDTLFDGERVYIGENVGTARMVGFEVEGVFRVGPFEGRANAVYTKGDQQYADGSEAPMSKIPPLGGSVGLRWATKTERFWVAYTLHWAVPQDRLGLRDQGDPRICPASMQNQPELCGTDGFTAHGVSAGAELTPQVVVTAGFDNIADRLYRTHASGVDSAGRSVWVGVSAIGVL